MNLKHKKDKFSMMCTNAFTFGIIDTLQKAWSGYFTEYSTYRSNNIKEVNK